MIVIITHRPSQLGQFQSYLLKNLIFLKNHEKDAAQLLAPKNIITIKYRKKGLLCKNLGLIE